MAELKILSPQPFVVMAKPVGSCCNMKCSYCYYLDKGKYSSHEKQLRMNLTFLEKMISQTIRSNPGPVVSFVWHGGEPTLAGLDFYKHVVELEMKYLPDGWQVWNNLQTNGLMLDDEWCKFLSDHHFDVGISIDGNEFTHDRNRKDLGGKGTYERVVKAVKRLKAAGSEPDLLCTVNADTAADPLGVYRALRDFDTGWIQFIPVVVRDDEGSISPISVTPEGYGRFLCDIFDEWAYNDLGKVDVQLFAETSKVMAGGEASLCTMAQTCGRVLIAEEDGSIYSCDHFVDPDHRIGNLKKDDIGLLAGGDLQTDFGNSKSDDLTRKCLNCKWLKYCYGGCPKDRFEVTDDGQDGQYYLCEGLEMFFSHACPVIEIMIGESRRGRNARQIMRKIRTLKNKDDRGFNDQR